jgi:hypothetical protein
MVRVIKSAGYGVLTAGLALLGLYFWSMHLKGNDALSDALDPLTLGNYRVLAAVIPGIILLWLGDLIAGRRQRHEDG